jgi:hypothetical protein
MREHSILWTSPTPLWGRFASRFSAADQARPAILRFASDEFMDQLLAMLATDPEKIGDTLARPETWRTPAAATPDLIERIPMPRTARVLARMRKNDAPSTVLVDTRSEHAITENNVDRTIPLKLYQPAHQRHYLVAANLVCQLPGFPDRAIATGGREQVGFVLRRLLTPQNGVAGEYAFVKDASGARWQRIEPDKLGRGADARLGDGEELLPLFPLSFRDKQTHPRRLLAGLIPVGRREEYMTSRAVHVPPPPPENGGSGGSGGQAGGATDVSARKEQLRMDIVEPWKNLVRTAHATRANIISDPIGDGLDDQDQRDAAKQANNSLQTQSWLLLLDFADFLSLHLKPVWDAVVDPSKRSDLTTDAQRRLFDWMDSAGTDPGSPWQISTGGNRTSMTSTLREALKKVRASQAVRTVLERAVRTYADDPGENRDWPNFLYLLAGVRGNKPFEAVGIHQSLSAFSNVVANADDKDASGSDPTRLLAIEAELALVDKLVPLVISAIDTSVPAQPAPAVPFAATLRDAMKSVGDDAGWFVLRCAYVRCDCGPLQPTVLSAPSQQFQLASFFDPDAPARPIRIALPVDTTPAGLRKFNKNTAFVMSDILCGQVQRAKGLGFIDLVLSVLPFPFHKDLNVGGMGPCGSPSASFGMICSLSIPIITICALILLIIIVTLLDLIFRWLPWFVICFPVPNLSGKK